VVSSVLFLHGGAGIQRLTYETWLQISEKEEKMPGGHAGRTGVGNLPRPKDRGGEVEFREMTVLHCTEDVDI